MLKAGDLAPNFTLKDQKGNDVSLSVFAGKKNVVVYFYPKDETPGCTAEACTFRDEYENFKEAGAEVIGISSDSSDSHSRFSAHHRLPFHLLSDAGGTVRKIYGVKATFGLIPGRVTFVIDKKGVIRHIFSSQLNAKKHVAEALRILREI